MAPPTPAQLAQIRETAAKAQASKKSGAEIQQELLAEANKVRIFEYKGCSMKLVKLPIQVFLRLIGRLPSKIMNPPPCPDCKGAGQVHGKRCGKCNGEGVYLPDNALTPDETAQFIDVACEALSKASPDGLTPDDIGRMCPPEFPEDFIGVAFRHLLLMNQATQKQIQELGFFRRKP